MTRYSFSLVNSRLRFGRDCDINAVPLKIGILFSYICAICSYFMPTAVLFVVMTRLERRCFQQTCSFFRALFLTLSSFRSISLRDIAECETTGRRVQTEHRHDPALFSRVTRIEELGDRADGAFGLGIDDVFGLHACVDEDPGNGAGHFACPRNRSMSAGSSRAS